MLEKYVGYILLMVSVFIISYQYNKKLMDFLKWQSLGTRDYIVEKLSIMFVDLNPTHVIVAQFILSFGMGIIVFLVLLPKVLPGIAFGILTTVLGWKAPKPIVNWLYQRRVDKFVLQMVDSLGLMANGMKSGLSISQSMSMVVEEMDDPIRQEFQLVLNQNKLGVPLEEALLKLSDRVESDEVEMFVTSVNILKETGGNLAETFDTIVITLRERIKIEKKIEAMVEQAKTQGMILLCVPPLMALVLHNQDPEFIAPLFNTTVGLFILLGIFLMEIVAFFVIRKIVNIEV